MPYRRTVSLGDISKCTSEDLKNILVKIQENSNENEILLLEYLNYIRNYNKLTDEMLENIKKMDEESKMTILKELNKLIDIINQLAYN
jgi:hypothetical protein